jgi:glycosyltransferase involved in cell wall biosynthesis
MKLLIITQKLDRADPILGFFHRWLEEFAKHTEKLTVVCLEKGEFDLPPTVRVLSLGKESGQSRLKYLARFYKYLWRERKNYDQVFVHMNQIYICLAGLVWRFLGKKVALWYTHKSVTWDLRLAVLFSHLVFTASSESFRLESRKLRVMGHGIDFSFFKPDTSVNRGSWCLSVGRLMKTKRHDLAIEAAARAGRELRVAGGGPERENLEALAKLVASPVRFLDGLTQVQLRDEYQRAAYLIHTSETGSLDKVVLEAIACGLSVVTTASSLADLPVKVVPATPQAIAAEIGKAPQPTEGSILYVRKHHSLQNLIPRILDALRSV